MCNDAEPHAISELVGYATDTLENFCADLPEESPKDESLMESSNALVELMVWRSTGYGCSITS
jgi:hypothetical protein